MGVESVEQNDEPFSYTFIGSGNFEGHNSYLDAVKLKLVGFVGTTQSCFSMFPNLKNVSFDDSLVGMTDKTFAGAHLEYFTVPKSVVDLSYLQCFDEGDPFIKIFVHPDNPKYCDIDGIVFSKDKKELYYWPGNHGEEYVIIPDFVEKVGIGAFGSSNRIRYVRYPPNVQYIGPYQFYRNTAIEYVEIQNKQDPNKYSPSMGDTTKIHYRPVPVATKFCPCYTVSYYNSILYLVAVIIEI